MKLVSSPSRIILFLVMIALYYVFSSMPLYPDEVAYRIMLERAYFNGGFKQSLTPYCFEGFLIENPKIFIPAATILSALSTLTYVADYRSLTFTLLCLAFVFALFVSQNSREKHRFLLVLALPLIGSSLWSMIVLRPEVFTIFYISLISYFSCFCKTKNKYLIYMINIIIILFYSILAYMHPKEIYLSLPTIIGLICLNQNINKNWINKFNILTTLSIILIVISSYSLHSVGFIKCAGFPFIEEVMKNQSISPGLILTNPLEFFHQLSAANSYLKWEYVINNIFFRDIDPINVLPSIKNTNIFWYFMNSVVIFLFLMCLAIYVIGIYLMLRIKAEGSKIFLEKIFYLSLFISIFVPFILNKNKHWYDAGLFYFSLSFSAYYLLNFNAGFIVLSYKSQRLIRFISKFIIISCLAGIFANYYYYAKEFQNGFEGIGVNSNYDFNSLNTKINALLGDADKVDKIIVDDITYDHFKHIKIVYPVTYLMLHGGLNPNTIRNVIQFQVINGVTTCDHMDQFNLIYPIEKLAVISSDGLKGHDICVWQTSR